MLNTFLLNFYSVPSPVVDTWELMANETDVFFSYGAYSLAKIKPNKINYKLWQVWDLISYIVVTQRISPEKVSFGLRVKDYIWFKEVL